MRSALFQPLDEELLEKLVGLMSEATADDRDLHLDGAAYLSGDESARRRELFRALPRRASR